MYKEDELTWGYREEPNYNLRICKWSGCSTILNIHNTDDYCAVHRIEARLQYLDELEAKKEARDRKIKAISKKKWKDKQKAKKLALKAKA